jgi:hypothetical protein
MTSNSAIDHRNIAIYDPERKGIFIHHDQLKESTFGIGDRFSIRKGKRELFALTIVKDDSGPIFYDKKGIFVQRTRKIDMLLGGIFSEYVIYIAPEIPDTIKIKALEMVVDKSQKWF